MNEVPILQALNKLMRLEEEAAALEADLNSTPAKLARLEKDIAQLRNEAVTATVETEHDRLRVRLVAAEAEHGRLTELNTKYWPRPAALP